MTTNAPRLNEYYRNIVRRGGAGRPTLTEARKDYDRAMRAAYSIRVL